jgi:ADP-ribosylglycohydrolase
VTTSVCWSLYAFLQAPASWWDAVCLAIRVGGDTDTLAAMTGAIAGARHGASALPGHLTAQLTDRGRWGLPELRVLAQRCHALGLASDSPAG